MAFLFEERPDRFIARAEAMNLSLERLSRAGLVDVLRFRGRDMTSDELIAEMQRAITRVGARRAVIDSATGLELGLSGARGLRDCLWRLLDQLSSAGLTVWLNASTDPAQVALGSLVDDMLTLRRVEHETWIENRLGIAKMRWSAHSTNLYSYQVREHGVRVTEAKATRPTNGCLFDVPSVGGAASAADRSLAIAS